MQTFIWLIISLFFLNNHYCQIYSAEEQPLLVLTIMVKNEAPVMQATLKPFLEAGLQHYLVLDTGSTDNTVQTVRELFKKYNIQHGYIVEQPFVNFAVSRNFALECAEEFFPQAVFFLMIDAEWYFHNVEGLLQFCEKYKNHPVNSFLIKRFFPESAIQDYVNWLFKAHKNIRFYGAVHEYTNEIAHLKAPDDIFISIDPCRTGKQKSSSRWPRDLNILLKEHEKNPSDLRTIFLIGQTYACLKKYEEALFWYSKRCNEKSNDEENYMAHYRMGAIYEFLKNWPQAIFYHFKAHQIRPQRIETLVHVAKYYLDIHNYYAAFLLAQYITTISISEKEIIFIASKIFNFKLYDILATAAWHVGEYEIGRLATLKGLEYDSSDTNLRQQLLLYEKALNHRDCNLLDRYCWCQWCNGNFWLNRPEWFNFCCFAHGCYRSNRLNLAQGITWRYWVGPFINLSI